MAHTLTPDDFDFAEYERQTECQAKVRPASAFRDDLQQRFRPPAKEQRAAEMFSTKLRGALRFRKGEVTCWTGYSKHRKSMFTGQVALDLCVQRERVLVASFEMYPADTLARMARQASGIQQPPSEHWLDTFSSWTNSRLWLFDHVGRISPAQCIALAKFFAEQKKGTQFFIDSMMMVCASEESADEQKQFATDIVRVAQETGLHIHLITHCRKPAGGDESRPPSKYDVRGSAAITDQAHNIVTVWANKGKRAKLDKDPHDQQALQEPDAAVTVEGQRNGSFEGRIKLWFHEDSMRFLDDQFANCEPYALVD